MRIVNLEPTKLSHINRHQSLQQYSRFSELRVAFPMRMMSATTGGFVVYFFIQRDLFPSVKHTTYKVPLLDVPKGVAQEYYLWPCVTAVDHTNINRTISIGSLKKVGMYGEARSPYTPIWIYPLFDQPVEAAFDCVVESIPIMNIVHK